ncbi:MAG: DUF2889 domain-containing protein [Thermodesulfobacteriota bacterium]|nr:DUF2889 domain-containing protein [Thermodesulfobacteriota bacterium]
MTLSFMRNKVVQVEPYSENSLAVSWRLADSLTEATIQIKVRLPDLEITAAEAQMERYPHQECASAPGLIQKIVGVRVGPGLRKIVQDLLGGPCGCPELAEGVLECCNAVILHFTVPQIQENEKGNEEERRKKYQAMLKFNPRLVRSCVAFADDSPLMQGLNIV